MTWFPCIVIMIHVVVLYDIQCCMMVRLFGLKNTQETTFHALTTCHFCCFFANRIFLKLAFTYVIVDIPFFCLVQCIFLSLFILNSNINFTTCSPQHGRCLGDQMCNDIYTMVIYEFIIRIYEENM